MTLLLCMALLPGLAHAAEEDMQARMDALEARIATLEAQMETLLAEEPAKANDAEAQPLTMGESLQIAGGPAITVSSFETGTRFRYMSSSSLPSMSIAAKSGYRLLCVYMTVDNNGRSDISTAQLAESTLHYGKDYSRKAHETFFYRNSKGAFASGLRSVGSGVTVDGCLLFTVPDTVDASGERVAITMTFGGVVYECVLRPAGGLVNPAEATTASF